MTMILVAAIVVMFVMPRVLLIGTAALLVAGVLLAVVTSGLIRPRATAI